MKPKRLVYQPTRSRRLNEMLGLVVLVAAGLLLLSLVTYTPSDPSFNTVGGAASVGAAGLTRPAHNWTGLFGAYTSDLLLQLIGAAVLLIPLALVRIGISWMRSRGVGAPLPKTAGLVLWLFAAPAALALLPGHLLWRHSLPIEGVEGRLLADGLIHFVNFPGAAILCGLMVALSLYLVTTFTLSSAREWFTSHFAFARNLRDRYRAWLQRRKDKDADTVIDAYESKRQSAIAQARSKAEAAGAVPAAVSEKPYESASLLSSFFGWFSRRKQDDLTLTPKQKWITDEQPEEHKSVWETMPRTVGSAAAATALTAAAQPLGYAETSLFVEPTAHANAASKSMFDDGWLDAPERNVPQSALADIDIPDPPPRADAHTHPGCTARRFTSHAHADAAYCGSKYLLRQACGRRPQSRRHYPKIDPRLQAAAVFAPFP